MSLPLPHGIGRPATGALTLRGWTTLEQLTEVTERELLALHGVGPKAVRVLRETMAEHGLSFAPDRR
ncbi:putative flap endonuclease-1-like 5' DNA nuclease [Saccharothrix coeruleofusca]|uniref:DNA-binding protein n=1 Tax=Saccharothrix coeruleofusca TaxID=33919 RepID=UPI001AE33B37|nr:DNA-binding protein [Saccharothrix coeruleofusca]MBP2335917.1 putative flap endonuclease-1-like 5' DNA nuclease [Saccharothrix coeruleofusca]